MSKRVYGRNENVEQDIGSIIIQHILCVKSNQGLVIWLTERLLPKLFWIGIIASIYFAFSIASINNDSIFSAVLTFIVALIASFTVVIISFYTIYVLKSLKDAFVLKEEDGCGCGKHDKEAKALDASTHAADPISAKAKRKPGPKKGSKRGRKPKAAAE
ncbi:MAG: hypothetical protein LBG21_05885 [Campylobacteraceae bacterium]|jgi:hypothetical protein|nr:hypothetical protein [Campylobacteraceae bacterium]